MSDNCTFALSQCTIKDGNLYFPVTLTPEEIKSAGDTLRWEMQVGCIRHTKVIGMQICAGSTIVSNYIKKSRNHSKSYAELAVVCQSLVFEELAGEPFKDFASKADPTGLGFVCSIDKHVDTDFGLQYAGLGSEKLPRSLIKHVDIMDFIKDGDNVRFVLKTGNNISDEITNGAHLGGTGFLPVCSYYDLTEFMAVKRYQEGDTCVKLMYKRDIDEGVLQSIIRNHYTR